MTKKKIKKLYDLVYPVTKGQIELANKQREEFNYPLIKDQKKKIKKYGKRPLIV